MNLALLDNPYDESGFRTCSVTGLDVHASAERPTKLFVLTAVIALVLGLGLRALALTAILTDGALAAAAALIVAAMVSRAAVLLAGTSGAAAVAAAALGAAVMARLARARIGGQTGDILGAVQQVAEIAALLCLLP